MGKTIAELLSESVDVAALLYSEYGALLISQKGLVCSGIAALCHPSHLRPLNHTCPLNCDSFIRMKIETTSAGTGGDKPPLHRQLSTATSQKAATSQPP
jgi:hypothetical protein